MPLIRLDSITIGDRQRKRIVREPLNDLKDSIRKHGLLQQIGARLLSGSGIDAKYFLVWGGRRLRAVEELQKDGVKIKHGQFTEGFADGTIPAVVFNEDDLANLLEMEFDENKWREPLSWQEETAAIEAIVHARKQRGETQTQIAQDISEKSQGGAKPMPVETVRKDITRAITVAAVLDSRPDLQKADSLDSAYKILLRERHEYFAAELARRELLQAKQHARLWDLRKGDLREVMLTIPDNTVTLVLADPPYGQDIHKEAFGASVLHKYDDSAAYALEILIFIIQESWRVTKSHANLFLFCSWEHFATIKQAAAQYGWSPFPHPLVWRKGDNAGHSPWGERGFRYDYEILFYATRGQLGVRSLPSDVLDNPAWRKVGSLAKIHGAEKPIPLLEFLIEIASSPNDLVLDPCAGSGSTLAAAMLKSRRSIGIEMDETYFNRAMMRLSDAEKEMKDAATTA